MLALMVSTDEPDDAELLERVARGVRQAQGELYRRHVDYLYAVVSKQCRALLELSQQSAEDLVHDTFERAFARAETFRRDGIVDHERLRRRVRAWLGRIAQHLLADALARPREVSDSPYLETLALPEPSESTARGNVQRLAQALATLSEREQDVLRVSALYQRVGDTHQRLPNAVAAELAQRWGTTNDNVRAIRSRALKKLMAEYSAQSSEPREDEP